MPVSYNQIKSLVTNSSSDAFFSSTAEKDGIVYEIFNYRLASYSDFNQPGALEARGIMFQITDDQGAPLARPKLVCLPVHKFFNLNECPFTMDLNLSVDNIKHIDMKEDGSLMSTFIHNNTLAVKSKGSLTSDQCQWAQDILDKDPEYARELYELTHSGYTVDMELTAPYNRIVLNYQQDGLTVLHYRDIETGEIHKTIDARVYPRIHQAMVKSAQQHLNMSTEQIMGQAYNLTDIEGFVVHLHDGTIFKLKTHWYVSLHRSKESVDTPRRLFEAVLYEGIDDLRSMFHDNPYVLAKIDDMEQFTVKLYNGIVAEVEQFVSDNRHLIEADNRKEYAIRGQQQLKNGTFGLAMMKYSIERGQRPGPVDYRDFCLRNWKMWGLGLSDVGSSDE